MADIKFSLVRGNSLVIQVAVKDGSGNVVDLTDASIWFTVKKRYSDSDQNKVFGKTSTPTGGIAVDDAESGLITITIQASDTTTLLNTYHTLLYDLKVKTGSGLIGSVMRGPFKIEPGVTEADTL